MRSFTQKALATIESEGQLSRRLRAHIYSNCHRGLRSHVRTPPSKTTAYRRGRCEECLRSTATLLRPRRIGGFRSDFGPCRGDPVKGAIRPMRRPGSRSATSAIRRNATSLTRLKCANSGRSGSAVEGADIQKQAAFVLAARYGSADNRPLGDRRPSITRVKTKSIACAFASEYSSQLRAQEFGRTAQAFQGL
jgi:hypothetical protein